MGSLLAKFISWFKGLFKAKEAPAHAEHVMPRELIARVLEECDRNAMEYSDSKRQLPCTFGIYLSEGDFDFFYRANRAEVEAEIVQALRQLAQQTGDRMKQPSVTLRIDSELERGTCRIDTSFEAVRAEATPPAVAPAARAAGGETPALAADAAPGLGHTPVLEVEPAVVAQVIAADGAAFDVTDGAVVGIVRDLGRELPDIALHTSPDLTYCGQRHGRFLATDDGGFAFQTLSRNGSVLVRDGASYRLAADEDPVALLDGDQLVLGKGNPAFTFVLTHR